LAARLPWCKSSHQQMQRLINDLSRPSSNAPREMTLDQLAQQLGESGMAVEALDE